MRHKSEDLLERLQSAAYDERVKFRAIQEGESPEDGYKDIDPSYFYVRPVFDWSQDVIFQPENGSSKPWYFVHLDRAQFERLLRDMGATVEPNSDSHALGKKIFKTGLKGRPSAVQLALPMAQSRLAAGDYPDTKREFSELIADAVAKAEPQAPRMGAKALRNNPEFSELWRRKPPKKIGHP